MSVGPLTRAAAYSMLCDALENLLRQIDDLQVPVKHPQQQAERDGARATLKFARGES